MFTIITNEKGKSIIANQNINKNVIIIKEKPAVIAEDMYDAIYQIYENNTDSIEDYENLLPNKLDKYVIKYDEIRKDIETLPFYMKDFFLNFQENKLRLLCAKFYRNAFRYNSQSAILYNGRLFNHACDNNLDFYLDKNGFYLFTTNRFIEKGEELTDHYIDTNLTYKKRQNILLTQYGFICNCNKCKK